MKLKQIIGRILPLFFRKWLRIAEVEKVFVKHLIGYITDQWALSKLARKRIKEEHIIYYPTIYERIRIALEELGPTYVKLGQILSTRPDMLPREVIYELSKLQEQVTPFSYEEAREQIRKNLGMEIEDIFSHFEKIPIAAASIGQVHLAKLKNGKKVIVKIQRPGIREKVTTDVSIMLWIAKKLEKYFQWARDYNTIERVREFGRFINEEMDYTIEARYCDTFRRNFAGYDEVYIPKIYWEYTNKHIMVMEYIEGIRIRELEKLDAAGINKLKVAKMIGRAYAKMILEDGFFHADPHPGNIFVFNENRFALIDFGMVGRLDKETKGYCAIYFLSLVNQDAPTLTEILFKMYSIPRDCDVDALRRDVGRLMAKYYGIPLGQVDIKEIVGELMELVFKYHILVPGEFTLFDKTFITLDGIGKMLAPEFDLLEEARPYAEKFIRSQFSIRDMLPDLVKNALILKDIALNLPRQTSKIGSALERGELQLQVHQQKMHEEMKNINLRLGSLMSRASLGLICAGLFIAGAILSFRENPHFIFGIEGSKFCIYAGILLAIFMLLKRR